MALPDSTSNVTVRKLAATLSSYNTKLNGKFDNKADKVANAVSGDLAGLDANGNLTDSGKKIDKVVVLDSNNKVPSQYLPSYVDDVVEGYYYNGKFYEESAHTHEITPEGGKIYVSLDTNKTYRWGGTEYVVIASDLALGETETTAYRGDRGKAAYDHSQLTSGNPHHVTASDVGLGNVDNTSDATKKTDFTGTIASGNTGFATGGAVYDALLSKGKGIEEVTLSNTYAEVDAIISAGKIPLLVEQETGSGRTLYYGYRGMRGDTYVFSMSEYVQTVPIGSEEPVSANVELDMQYLNSTGWHWNHSISENTENKVASWDAADAGGYKYPTAKLVKDSLDQKAAASHTHTTTIASDTGTSAITLASGGKYKLSTGGTSTVFTMPTIPDAANDGALKIGLNGGAATNKFTANQSTDSTLTFATGSANGTIAVDGTDVSVKGLGTAAYTAATDYATSGHTHTTTLATSSGTATVTVAPGSKYQLTAGGTSVIFDVPEMSDTEITDLLAELN